MVLRAGANVVLTTKGIDDMALKVGGRGRAERGRPVEGEGSSSKSRKHCLYVDMCGIVQWVP